MSLALAVMIVLIVLVIAALAVFLIATIVQLVKINRGLAAVISSVGEIAAKTAPVNGVLDAINGTLITGRNLLEGLFLKKAGDDAGGLVESVFPGEGAKFQQRVGRGGPVHNIGPTYPRGAAILASLLGTPPPAAEAAAPPPAHGTPEGRIRLSPRSPSGGVATAPPPAPAPPPAVAAPPAADAPPPTPGRITLRSRAAPMISAQPASSPAQPGPGASGATEDASVPGRASARGSRPWER